MDNTILSLAGVGRQVFLYINSGTHLLGIGQTQSANLLPSPNPFTPDVPELVGYVKVKRVNAVIESNNGSIITSKAVVGDGAVVGRDAGGARQDRAQACPRRIRRQAQRRVERGGAGHGHRHHHVARCSGRGCRHHEHGSTCQAREPGKGAPMCDDERHQCRYRPYLGVS